MLYLTDYLPSSGGSSLYQCASVDTVNHTWTGYSMTKTGDTYIQSSEVTSGLVYTLYIPTVGKIYTSDALIQCSLKIEEGLVFYAPLSADVAEAETGQTLTKNGTITYQTQNGIPCAYFNGSSCISIPENDWKELLTAAGKLTISCWVKVAVHTDYAGIVTYGPVGDVGQRMFQIIAGSSITEVGAYVFDNTNTDLYRQCPEMLSWVNFSMTYDGTVVTAYANGTQLTGVSNISAMRSTTKGLVIGGWYDYATLPAYSLKGYVAGVRIFNRSLTPSEIAILANEFTPTA